MRLFALTRLYLRGDRAAALVLMAVMTGYAYESTQLSRALSDDVVGPSFYPALLSVIGFGLAVLLFLRPETNGEEEPNPDAAAEPYASRIESLLPWVLLVTYVAGIKFIGFPAATFLFVALLLKLFKQPSWGGAGTLAFFVTAAALLIFRWLLDIPLPMGPFFEDY